MIFSSKLIVSVLKNKMEKFFILTVFLFSLAFSADSLQDCKVPKTKPDFEAERVR
jgi:hypothetical protein